MSKTKSLRSWLDNFWYHNKWKTIFVAFAVMVIAICFMQGSVQTDYDAKILYVGPHFFDANQKGEAESAFSQILGKDYNDDGKMNALVADLTILTHKQLNDLLNEKADDPTALSRYGQYSEDMRKQHFAQETAVGENIICLMDPYWYGLLCEKEGLAKLEDVLGYRPAQAIDDYGIYLKDSAFGQFYDVFGNLPDDTILCMRIFSASMAASGKKEMRESYEYHEDIFKKLVEFTLPEGFVPQTKPQESTSETANS